MINTHVARALTTAVVAGTMTLAAWLGTAVASADPYDQRSFPCQEDEVLGFAPRFGPDRVGCIHIDELR